MKSLLPTARFERIFDITPEFLKENGIELVLCDMDNTLAPWHSDYIDQSTALWTEKVKQGGVKVALLTNSKGTNADSIGKKLDIPVYKDAKKPFRGYTENLLKTLGVNPENVLFAGDQLFTDIRLANKLKAKSVLTTPISDREWWYTKVFNRSRERLVWRFLFKK